MQQQRTAGRRPAANCRAAICLMDINQSFKYRASIFVGGRKLQAVKLRASIIAKGRKHQAGKHQA